jgi:RNA polymerase-binding transcription factor DksA
MQGAGTDRSLKQEHDMDLPTQTHLTTLRDMLTYRLGELRADVRSAEQHRRDAERAAVHDIGDRKDDAADAVASGIEAAEEQRDIDEAEDVEAALHRLDEGVYGDCLDCGEPIPLQRLFAQPAAKRCADCQAARERLPTRSMLT